MPSQSRTRVLTRQVCVCFLLLLNFAAKRVIPKEPPPKAPSSVALRTSQTNLSKQQSEPSLSPRIAAQTIKCHFVCICA